MRIEGDIIDRALDLAAREAGLSDDQWERIELQLRREYGGNEIYVPQKGRRRTARRNERILLLLDQGLTLRAVAAAVGCSVGTVAGVKASAPYRLIQEKISDPRKS